MKQMKLLLLTLITPLLSLAHPSSYEGGLDFMGSNHINHQSIELIYSPKYWLGTGLLLEKKPDSWESTSIQLGYLAKRWNLPAAQGNFYLLLGPGYGSTFELDDSKTTDLLYRYGLQADYETRRIYTFAKFTEQRFFNTNDTIYSRLELRIGYAPYLAKFTELNSWLILKTVFTEEYKEVTYIPTVRLFYKNFLVDIGVDLDGNTQLNFMARH